MVNNTIIVIGADGYIGNALVQRLLFKGYQVIGIDNFIRRNWVKVQMNSHSATKIKGMKDKKEEFQKIGNFEFMCFDISKDIDILDSTIATYKPGTIINLGHIPSGPYSMASHTNANITLSNNIIGTNNLLWSMKKHCPDCHYITIGTTGEYDHCNNIDIEEGYIQVEHNGRQSTEMIYPRRPGSIYHTSKTSSTYLIDFLAKSWGIKCTDVQQSVVFGIFTDEIDQTKIYSRFDSDEAAGTVLNRFIVQSLLNIPLTVYGEGKHQRGFISLNDSIQALQIAVDNPAEKGHVQVWNQLSEWHSMNDIANMVSDVHGDVEISHIPTLRNEHTGEHYYNYITKKLKSFGYKPTRTIKQEIEYCLNILKTDIDHIKPLQEVVIPKIKWR